MYTFAVPILIINLLTPSPTASSPSIVTMPPKIAKTAEPKKNKAGSKKRVLEDIQSNSTTKPQKRPKKAAGWLKSTAETTSTNKTATVIKSKAKVTSVTKIAKYQKTPKEMGIASSTPEINSTNKTAMVKSKSQTPIIDTTAKDQKTLEKIDIASSTAVEGDNEATTEKYSIAEIPGVYQTARRLGDLRLSQQLLIPEAIKDVIGATQVGSTSS